MKEKLKEYEDYFDDGFPTFYFMHLPPEEISNMIDVCIREGKDAYEMGFLKEPSENSKY